MTHQLIINAIYHLPNPKFQGFLGKLGSGWWTSNIITWHTGPYWEPNIPGALSQTMKIRPVFSTVLPT